jgi:hypothetical protein
MRDNRNKGVQIKSTAHVLSDRKECSMAKRRVRPDVTINRPVGEVFAYVSDMNNHSIWQSNVLESRLTSPGAAGVGSAYCYFTQLFGSRIQTEGEILTCDMEKGFPYRSTSGPFQIVGGYTFEKVIGGTKVTQRIVADISWFFRLAEPIVVRSVQRNLQGNLLTLKEMMET